MNSVSNELVFRTEYLLWVWTGDCWRAVRTVARRWLGRAVHRTVVLKHSGNHNQAGAANTENYRTHYQIISLHVLCSQGTSFSWHVCFCFAPFVQNRALHNSEKGRFVDFMAFVVFQYFARTSCPLWQHEMWSYITLTYNSEAFLHEKSISTEFFCWTRKQWHEIVTIIAYLVQSPFWKSYRLLNLASHHFQWWATVVGQIGGRLPNALKVSVKHQSGSPTSSRQALTSTQENLLLVSHDSAVSFERSRETSTQTNTFCRADLPNWNLPISQCQIPTGMFFDLDLGG